MLYPFGFPFIPPATPTEQTYQRLGVARLDGILENYTSDTGFLDSAMFSIAYPNEKQFREAYGFVFVYNDNKYSFNCPCSIVYDGSKYVVSITGYALKTLIDPTALATSAHILYFKKGVLK